VNVCDQWDVDTLFDCADGERIFFFWHGYTHDFTANLFQAMDLCNGTFHVAGVGSTH
jgi:hypothetical protein